MSATPTGPPAAQRRAARSRFRARRLAAGVPLGVLATILATLALAPSGSAGAAAGGANIRLAHLSPDTPEMDVYVVGFDGSESKALEGLGYGEVSDYAPLDAGEYTFLLRPAGAPADSDPAVTASATLDSGDAYTFAAMGPNADLHQALLTDDLTAPPGGQAKVRLIQASSTAADVTVQVEGGPLLAQDVPFADATGYANVASGQWTITATSSTGASVSRSLSLDPGTVNSLVVLEGTGSEPFDLTRVVDGTGVDATGAARGEGLGISTAAPLGGVATGGGGTAGLADAGSGSGSGSGSGGVNPVAVAVGVGVLVALAYGGTQLRKAHRPDGGLAGPAGRHAGRPSAPDPRAGSSLAGAGTAGPGVAVRPEAQLVGVGAGDTHAASGTALRAPSAVWAAGPGSSGPDGPAGRPTFGGGDNRRRGPVAPPAGPAQFALDGVGWATSEGPGAAPLAPGAEPRAAGGATPPSAWPFAGDPGASPYRDDRSSGRPRR